MYKILLATDGSANSLRAAEAAAKLAGPLKAKVTVISVAQETYLPPEFAETLRKSIKENAQKAIDKTKDLLEEKGINTDTLLHRGSPGNVICEVADKEGYNLIILGNSGLGSVEELFLGSVSNTVVHRAKTSVMIVK
ncbi:MAG: universal stress protein [Firmicutes bacterium]|nr:universal stress protein [Bacillota bacterium]